jgi:hypothetical protein
MHRTTRRPLTHKDAHLPARTRLQAQGGEPAIRASSVEWRRVKGRQGSYPDWQRKEMFRAPTSPWVH